MNEIDEIILLIHWFDTSKRPELLTQGFQRCCRTLFKIFDLESCMLLFHDRNPFLAPFVVTYPQSNYSDYDTERIKGMENELVDQKKAITAVPIRFAGKRIGALLLVRRSKFSDHVISNGYINMYLIKLTEACARTIRKLVSIHGRGYCWSFMQKLRGYAINVDGGGEKRNRFILELLQVLFVPRRVFLTNRLDDGSYIYYHASMSGGNIKDDGHGTFKEGSLAFMINEVKKDEPGIMEINIEESGMITEKLMVAFERTPSVFNYIFALILKSLLPFLAAVLDVNLLGARFEILYDRDGKTSG